MKNEEQIVSNVEHYISNNFKKVQKYFPMLSHQLLNLTSTNIPTLPCQISNYLNAKMFLYVLCFLCDSNSQYIKAHQKFEKLLTKEDLPDSYFKFNDGYIYSKSFNQTLLNMQIKDTVLDFKIVTKQLIKEAKNDVLKLNLFRNFSINLLTQNNNKYLNNGDDMYSNEYLEMLFIENLINCFKFDIQIENYQNKDNKSL